jgi:N-glycosylase/DNA lyase
MRISVSTPPNFNFRRTVLSHGWYALPPFEFDEQKWTLRRVIDLGSARPVTVRISRAKKGLLIDVSGTLGKRARDKIIRDVRHIFRLDDDMDAFYQTVAHEPEFAWIASEGAGRLLRSPTVFEDLVKMICTTNCSWALTEKMVNALVEHLGFDTGDGRKSFPTPTVMAQQPEKFYRDRIRAGYRAPYLRELAQRVASGEIDVESWLPREQRGSSPTVREGARSHGDFMKEIKQVKGVGNYAAENLLKLLGRYDGLALDSWTRAQFAKLRNNDRAASDKKIARYYKRFNSWRGLVLWCDMTRHWLQADQLGDW